MKICIVGPGAIGGSIAARFAANTPHTVATLARGSQLAAIRARGLTLVTKAGRLTATTIHAADDAAALGPQDMVVLALKAYSLAQVAPHLAPLITPETVIVPVQNGIPWWYFHKEGGKLDGTRLDAIDPDGAIGAALNPAQVVGAVTYAGAKVPEPGVIDLSLDEEMIFGEPDGSASPRLAAVVDAFARAGFAAKPSEAIRAVIWLKLWGNATMNPISVLANCTTDRLIADAAVRATCAQAMAEVRDVAGALGLRFAFTIEQRFKQAEALGAFKTSMLQDYEAGRPLEVEALVGVVCELARKLGVAVPVLDTLYALTRLRGVRPAS